MCRDAVCPHFKGLIRLHHIIKGEKFTGGPLRLYSGLKHFRN